MNENSEKILSIIVPAYNMEKYLKKCIESMLEETVLNAIEIVIVNDGSIDSTEKIAQKFVSECPNVIKYVKKENGGHGSAINCGIGVASGKYFKIVDADDMLNKKELPPFIDLLSKVSSDIVASNFLCISDANEHVFNKRCATTDSLLWGKEVYISEGQVENIIKMHSMTIKTDILKKNAIRLTEKCFYVDAEYITYPIPFCDSIYFYNQDIYLYRLGRKNQSMNIVSMQKNIRQHAMVLDNLICWYKSLNGLSEETMQYICNSIAQVVEDRFQIYISMGSRKGIINELRSFDTDLKENVPEIYFSTKKKSIDILRHTNYLILPIGAIIYRIVKHNRF